MLDQIKPNTLADYVGSSFQVLGDLPKPVSLTLTRIVELAKVGRQEIFSIYFHGPGDLYLPQAIYQLKHEQAGEIGLFLVPVAKDKDGFEYECAFNNLI